MNIKSKSIEMVDSNAIKIQSKEIKMVPIGNIVEHPKNANRHSIDQIERLCKLIQFQGFRSPLIISNRSGFLVSGHGRKMAAEKLNMTELPCVYQDFADEATEYAFVISDNEIARWAELDFQSVYDEMKDLEIPDIELLGMEKFEGLEEKIDEIKDMSDDDVKMFAVEVKLPNEMEQQDLYDDLVSKGYDCKVMSI